MTVQGFSPAKGVEPVLGAAEEVPAEVVVPGVGFPCTVLSQAVSARARVARTISARERVTA